MYFGVISPKIRTATVMTAVEITVESIFEFMIIFAKRRVEIADAERLTILFPIKIVLKSLSYFFSASSRTRAARLLPFVTKVRSLILEAHENAVSVAEKNPESKIRMIKEMSKDQDPAGIKIVTSN